MKRIILMGMVAMGCVSLAQAQQQKTGEEQFVVYKWYQDGRAHYAKTPPRGVTNFVKLNEYGIVITERPDTESFQVLRPSRSAAGQSADSGAKITPVTATPDDKSDAAKAAKTEAAKAAESTAELPSGTITPAERCKSAQADLAQLSANKKNYYEEDANGNLVPLDAAGVESRKAQAQQDVNSFCN